MSIGELLKEAKEYTSSGYDKKLYVDHADTATLIAAGARTVVRHGRLREVMFQEHRFIHVCSFECFRTPRRTVH